MEIIVIFLILMIVLSIKGIFDKRNNKKRLVESLIKSWGTPPSNEYTSEKFLSLQYYYKNRYSKKEDMKERFFVDDITWHDLSMDELFSLLNATNCSMGEEYLWAILHDLKFEKEPLEEREALISFFEKNEKERLQLQTAFAMIGKNKRISVYEYMDRIDTVKRESNTKHFALLGGIIVSIFLLFVIPSVAGFLLLFLLAYNIISYYKRKGEIAPYFSAISYLIRMLEHGEQLSKESHEKVLEPYYEILQKNSSDLKNFRKGAPVVSSENPTGDMMSFFLDYVRILFHTDLIRFNLMLTEFFKKKEQIVEVFEIVGLLDAMCAIASFRAMLPVYCIPEFSNERKYHAKELYHPFLKEPVPANMITKKSVLITGSNASGKSTFIKSAAMNAILSQTIHTVCAKEYQSSFFKVMTSMALTDNLFTNESYYIAEIKSLQRILQETNGTIPVLGFVDEVLRGTNTVERISASSQILATLSRSNALMFAATHDIELTYMLEELFENYHFEEQIKDKEILFDYQLKTGRATTQNAIALLRLLGYPEEITKSAKDTATKFLLEGEWQKV